MPRIGIIGTGGMAESHARSFASLPFVELVACCDVVEERARTFAARWRIPAVFTDPAKMLETARLDGVSIVTPDAMHAPLSIQALEKKIAVLSEKPMSTSLSDAQRMLDAARHSGVANMVNYSKRDSSALQNARELIASGKIGRIRHVEANYLQCWLTSNEWGDWRTTPAFTWRLSKKHGSLGALGDIGCHIYDAAAFLCGDIAEISCRLATFDKGVPGNRVGEYDLDANDGFAAQVVFENGAIGTVDATRWAPGFLDRVFVRVSCERATVELDLTKSRDSFRLFRAGESEWETIACPETPSNYARFIRALMTGEAAESDFANGLKVQRYLDASFRSDALHAPVAAS